MHAANLDRSERLRRILKCLRENKRHGLTTLDLFAYTGALAPSTCISELRHNGHAIDCKIESDGKQRIYRYFLK